MAEGQPLAKLQNGLKGLCLQNGLPFHQWLDYAMAIVETGHSQISAFNATYHAIEHRRHFCSMVLWVLTPHGILSTVSGACQGPTTHGPGHYPHPSIEGTLHHPTLREWGEPGSIPPRELLDRRRRLIEYNEGREPSVRSRMAPMAEMISDGSITLMPARGFGKLRALLEKYQRQTFEACRVSPGILKRAPGDPPAGMSWAEGETFTQRSARVGVEMGTPLIDPAVPGTDRSAYTSSDWEIEKAIYGQAERAIAMAKDGSNAKDGLSKERKLRLMERDPLANQGGKRGY